MERRSSLQSLCWQTSLGETAGKLFSPTEVEISRFSRCQPRAQRYNQCILLTPIACCDRSDFSSGPVESIYLSRIAQYTEKTQTF